MPDPADTAAAKRSRYARWRVLFWNLVLIGVGVCVLEGIYGTWFSGDPMQLLHLRRNSTLHFKAVAMEIKPEDRHVIYRRDNWGLRGKYGLPEDIDILTVGGSTTDQRYVSEGKTWQDVLQDKFKAAGKDIRVANAGISGRTTFGHLRDFVSWFPNIPGLQPAYVLFYVGVNDMFYDKPHGKGDQIYRDEIRYKDYKQWIRENSATYFVYRTLVGLYQAYNKDLTHTSLDFRNGTWIDQPVRTDYNIVLKPRLSGFRTRLTRLGRAVQRIGATPIFVTQPRGDYLVQEDGRVLGLKKTQSRISGIHNDALLGVLDRDTGNGVDYYLMIQLFNEVTLKVCKELGGICVDLFNEVRFAIGDFYDHVHNTADGSAKIGEYLFNKLNPQIRGRAGG